ncbi:DUF3710 domain-containing protein [Saxibacter everestensis]|uniref:DUF3710 domain-containing protein n=1 Tax=Saxibacter everestensis TaxID=2909229 RepID=A0ABY8QWI6_9MICO|nr:DUF3710 domain-containing protein [Brevibacteriaceae bacterium ZFBP1038]
MGIFGRRKNQASADSVKGKRAKAKSGIEEVDQPEDDLKSAAVEAEAGDEKAASPSDLTDDADGLNDADDADDADQDDADDADGADEDDADQDDADDADGADEDVADEDEPAAKSGPLDRADNGPFDEAEADDAVRIDLGALRIKPVDGMQLRLDVDESGNRIVSVTLIVEGATLQLQAFAAPRSEGLWREIRKQISASVSRQGGTVDVLHTKFGKEVLARIPARTDDNRTGVRQARFIGVDGPRWFLRAVVGGKALTDDDAKDQIESLLRSVVVVRGDEPMPPRELLKVTAPTQETDDDEDEEQKDSLNPFERGPEITEIR